MQENQEQVKQVIQSPIQPITSKKTSGVVMLLSSLLLITVVIAGFFAYQTQKLAKELTAYSVQKEQTPTPEPSDDPTSDWKTYINEKYGFSFKYPMDWSIDDKTRTKDGKHSYLLELVSNYPNSKNSSIFMVSVFQMDTRELSQWVIDHSPLGEKTPTYFYLLEGWYKKSITNGLESFTIESKYPQGKYAQNISVIFSNNSKAYSIAIINPFPEEQTIFNQILSTFKFTK